jgi:hypothetical protein
MTEIAFVFLRLPAVTRSRVFLAAQAMLCAFARSKMLQEMHFTQDARRIEWRKEKSGC